MKNISDFDFEKKRVLVRCDFDVPLDEKGNILDDFRIEKTAETIRYLAKNNGRIILMSHLKGYDGKTMKMEFIHKKLMERLGLLVITATDSVGKRIEDQTMQISPGEILLLENLRFHDGEKKNNQEFVKNLVKLGDIYINECFATCHRNHASIAGIPRYLPSAPGIVLEKEIEILSKVRENPDHPLVAIMGGTVHERRELMFVEKMSEKADFVLIGGLIQKAIEEKKFSFSRPEKIILPIKGDVSAFDLGPETLKIFKEKISLAKTIFWSGPVGKVEDERFTRGTREIAEAIVAAPAFKVAGGGQTIHFLKENNFASKFNHLSTGGGAVLAFLAGEKLPGIEAIQ